MQSRFGTARISITKIQPLTCGCIFVMLFFWQGHKDLNPGHVVLETIHIKMTVQIVPTVEPFVALGLLNLMPFDALLMLLKNLGEIDAAIT